MINNYRLILKLSTLPKLFEELLVPKMSSIFNSILINEKYGFRTDKSINTHLVGFYSFLMQEVSTGKQVDVEYTNLRKTFDTVDHDILIGKFRKIGVTDLFLT